MPVEQERAIILMFANSSSEEIKHKPIQKGKALFEYCTMKTLREIEKSNLPYVIYTEKEQRGDSFEERLVNAIQEIFSQGYQKIITIGNDSPELKATDLVDANRTISEKNIVIGPSMDGGIYLLGIHKTHFQKEIILQLPWKTPNLMPAMIDFFRKKQITLHIKKRLRDIDTISDVKCFSGFFKTFSYSFLQLLSYLLQEELKQFRCMTPLNYIAIIQTGCYNKGSPQLINSFS